MDDEASPNKQEENRWRTPLRRFRMILLTVRYCSRLCQSCSTSGPPGADPAERSHRWLTTGWRIRREAEDWQNVGLTHPPNVSSRTAGVACRKSANAETGHGISRPRSMLSATYMWQGACSHKRVSHA